MEPGRLLELPPTFTKQRRLFHTPEVLDAVWPDSKGYTDGLRQTLLSLLHRFDLAYELRDASVLGLQSGAVHAAKWTQYIIVAGRRHRAAS